CGATSRGVADPYSSGFLRDHSRISIASPRFTATNSGDNFQVLVTSAKIICQTAVTKLQANPCKGASGGKDHDENAHITERNSSSYLRKTARSASAEGRS